MNMLHDVVSAIQRAFGHPPDNPFLDTDKELEEAKIRFDLASRRHSRASTAAAIALDGLVSALQGRRRG